ncbi:LamG-like jellyroll fold domain-containing protein [Herbaspirillum sp. NPDC101397]|uniref:DUF7483 domain-containing protein n=1 Tax=Herbaspirillum sp. NPDC101397 TaxID=3364006 RepID=UPI00383B11BA
MNVPGSPNAALLGSSSQYRVSRSLRLRSAATAYLSRTFGAPTTQNTFTLSMWVKRGELGRVQTLFGATTTNFDGLLFLSTDALGVYVGGSLNITTAALFRDPSAQMHIVLRAIGTAVTLFANNNIVGSGTTAFPILNSALLHLIGQNSSANYYDGLISEVVFVDGQGLSPSSFGETDPATGVWNPKRYAGTYGNNGFYESFEDNSGATSATIGKDKSGNNNDWTPVSISVTAGINNDSLADTPTNYDDGANGRGNYPTLNPLQGTGTRTQGNLAATGAYRTGSTQLLPKTGKWYAEFSCSGSNAAADFAVGVGTQNLDGITHPNPGASLYYSDNQYMIVNGTNLGNFAATAAIIDVIQIAYDADTGKLYLGKNNVFYLATAGTGNPSAGANPSTTLLAGDWQVMVYTTTNNTVAYANFGQRPFAYSPPTGFKALNTQNLPTPSILAPNKLFDATVYAGTGAAKSVVNAGAFAPDLVWSKSRSIASSNILADSVRGATTYSATNTGATEGVDATMYSAFNSDGFSIGTNSAINANAASYVAWQWKKGVIPGFDVVAYTGNDTARSIAHSLAAVPALKVIKQRTGTRDWFLNHKGIAATSYLLLDGTDAPVSNAALFAGADTSSMFNVGSNAAVNGGGFGYIAYLWAEIPGFSKFGIYVGNGNANGAFVHCGFRPKIVWVKRVDSTGSHVVHDAARDPMNLAVSALFPNLANAESTGFYQIDMLSNGFKMRNTDAETNASGGTFIYMAFAENPFKYARAK